MLGQILILGALKGMVSGLDITDVQPRGDVVHYTARSGGVTKAGTRIRAILDQIINLPPRLPDNLTLTEGERGPIAKEYRVEWDVPRTKFRK